MASVYTSYSYKILVADKEWAEIQKHRTNQDKMQRLARNT